MPNNIKNIEYKYNNSSYSGNFIKQLFVWSLLLLSSMAGAGPLGIVKESNKTADDNYPNDRTEVMVENFTQQSAYDIESFTAVPLVEDFLCSSNQQVVDDFLKK